MMHYNDPDYLYHHGVKGMKWGVKRRQQKANYKLVKKRLKETNTNSMKLQNYERGGVSRKKVKKYLGKDITVSQVNDYIKHKNRMGNIGAILTPVLGMSLAVAMTYKR